LDDADPELKLERTLLRRLNAQQPPVGSVERGWAALAGEIGALGPGSAATHATAQHTLATSKWVAFAKLGAAVGVAGGVVWGSVQLLSGEAAPPAPALAPAPRAHGSPAASPPAPAPLANESAPLESAPRSEQQPSRAALPGSTLAEEGKLLAKARQLAQSGHAREALELLQASAQRFPRSVLSQEREVLTIEALAASGNLPSAKQRAQRFLQRYPTSPYLERLQRFTE
jgi:hypothetical protein